MQVPRFSAKRILFSVRKILFFFDFLALMLNASETHDEIEKYEVRGF